MVSASAPAFLRSPEGMRLGGMREGKKSARA